MDINSARPRRWKPPFPYDQVITAPLPTFDGPTKSVSMQGWYWNTLDWICHVTKGKRKAEHFVKYAEDGINIYGWDLTFDEAVLVFPH